MKIKKKRDKLCIKSCQELNYLIQYHILLLVIVNLFYYLHLKGKELKDLYIY